MPEVQIKEVPLKAQGGSLKVAVYPSGGLFILLKITTTWLLGETHFTAQGKDHEILL